MQKLHYLFKIATEFAADIIYPKRCAVCQKLLTGYTHTALCPKCLNKSLELKVVRDDRYRFDEAIGVLKYEGAVRRAMIKYKFKSVKYYAKAYAHVMDTAVVDRTYFKDALICPVPLSVTRERDYSQTLLIARELASMWNSELIEDLLIRCAHVKQLSKMRLPERRFYIKGAMDVNPRHDIYGRDILIIDDIFTSGTTANECANVLKLHGADSVYILCPCYD